MKITFIIAAIVLCIVALFGFVFSARTNIAGFSASIFEIMTGEYKNQGMITLSLSQLQNEPKMSRLIPYTRCSFQSGDSPSRIPIVINEVAWMGSDQSFTHEWIELRNVSGAIINMSGWQILNENEKIHITFPQQSIFDTFDKLRVNKQFMVLARLSAVASAKEGSSTNDALQFNADIIFIGAIRNSNEGLRLFDNNCRLIDEVFASPNWPAGDNRTKQTMERLPAEQTGTSDLLWVNSLSAGGTPGRENTGRK